MEGHRDVLGSEAPVTPATELDAEVVVVGTGPTGAAAALALSTYGINVLLVTQHGHLSDTPRAHITNQRTMEVLRDLGVADEVARYATPWEAMGDTLFTTSLAGPEIARIRAWGTGEDRIADYLRTSPCTPLDVSQPDMESVLVRHATTRGATLRFATRYLGHEQDDDGVSVRLEDRHLGHVYTVRCRYLIGADGARSKIAEDLGLVIEGTMARAATVYVHFEADLRRYVEHRRSVLYWILSEGAAHGEIGMGLLRAVRPWTRWIAGWGHDMSTGEPDLSEHTIRERVQGLIGDPEPEIRIERSTTWFVNEAYATTYARGRVLCAGDAVHRHPPSNGLGSNTGIQDAYNLAWKLAFVLRGWAGRGLLESYTDERAPVGRQVVERANKSRLDFGPLQSIVRGTGPDNTVADALTRLRQPGPDGVAMRAGLERAVTLKNYEFNALGVETNHRYESSAVLGDPDGPPERWMADRQLYPQPTTRPGAKIPHAWLVDAHGERISTLDITGQGMLTLLTGLSGGVWADAAERLGLPCLRVVVIGRGGVDDLYFSWQRAREVEEAGAILVRPDGYVAWRHQTVVADPEQARRLLSDAIGCVLDRTDTAVGAGSPGSAMRNS
jgi:2,4-dichlorophenol 6-monooxygenase